MYIVLIFFLYALEQVGVQAQQTDTGIMLSTSETSYQTGIQGFAKELQCRLSTCVSDPSQIEWYKNGAVVMRGLEVVAELPPEVDELVKLNKRLNIRHDVFFNHTLDCSSSTCSDVENTCPAGQACLENSCCLCSGEQFSLFITNLTIFDAGLWECKYTTGDDIVLDEHRVLYDLEVIEGGLEPGFHKNYTYDHSDCCKKNQVKDECMPLCNVGRADLHTWDPDKCKDDIKPFLGCVTEGQTKDHLHCCKLQLVPPFCWDFCSGHIDEVTITHRLCLFWLQELLECYEHAFLPYPEQPDELIVNVLGPDSVQACWQPPVTEPDSLPVLNYTVHYKEIPQLPFFGGGLPIFSGGISEEIDDYGDYHDYDDHMTWGDPDEGDYNYYPAAPSPPPTHGRRSEHGRRKRNPAHDLARYSVDSEAAARSRRSPEGVHIRLKRQKVVVVAKNSLTNETQTQIREFSFTEVNTTDTCYTIPHLHPSTSYFVFVTATNTFGTSLPSLREVAETEARVFPAGSMPNIMQCCKDAGVDAACQEKLCDIEKPPVAFQALDISLNCREEFPRVSPCLADKRDHTPCCNRRGVKGECLKLCNGSAEYLGLGSVICLTLDMKSIYSCLQEGYVTHPTPPQNMTVTQITEDSAVVSWDLPSKNSETVRNVSLFYQPDDHRHGVTEIKDVKSPHLLVRLQPNTPYWTYVVAHGEKGSSLQSTRVEFFTIGDDSAACSIGVPLLNNRGERFQCDVDGLPCPPQYICLSDSISSEQYCCPTDVPLIEPPVELPTDTTTLPDLRKCCQEKAVNQSCVDLCTFEATPELLIRGGEQCVDHIEEWVECGSDGRDHRPCCAAAGVPPKCQIFCYPDVPKLTYDHLECITHVTTITQCAREGILRLPGPARSLRLEALEQNSATLRWTVPFQNTEVQFYKLILYETQGYTVAQNINVPHNDEDRTISHRFNDLASNEYVANVVSVNKHGTSIPSNNVTFSVGDLDGSQKNPVAPHELQVAWQRGAVVNLTWSFAGHKLNNDDVRDATFHINYHLKDAANSGQSSHGTHGQSSVKERWIVLDNLVTNVQYLAWVTAEDMSDGAKSHDSEIISFAPITGGHATDDLAAFIQVKPDKQIFNVGDEVTIMCFTGHAKDGSMPTVTLRTRPDGSSELGDLSHVKKTAPGEVEYTFTIAEKDHLRLFVCQADSPPAPPRTADRRLLVSFKPRVSAPEPSLKVFENSSAVLVCIVNAFPQPKVVWSFRNAIAGPSAQYVAVKNTRNTQFTTIETNPVYAQYESTLVIHDVKRRTHAGSYECSANNELGEATAQLSLTVDTAKVPPGSVNTKECCSRLGVKSECMPICDSFAVDASKLADMPECEVELPKLISCAKQEGHDRTGCCIHNLVDDSCLKYCKGYSALEPGASEDLLPMTDTCRAHKSEIIHCLQPAPEISVPEDVDVRVLKNRGGKTDVEVTWKTPLTNPDVMEKMIVYYQKEGRGNQWNQVEVPASQGKAVVKELDSSAKYAFAVLAGNEDGFSNFAFHRSLDLSSPGSFKKHSGKRSGGGNHVGTAIGIILVLMLVFGAAAFVLHLARRPNSPLGQKLPAVFRQGFSLPSLHRRGPSSGTTTNGSVSFANPTYGDDDGTVRGLPESTDGSSAFSGNESWQSAELEPAQPQSEQKGMKYAQLT